jgi:hypothetical protein
MGSSLSINVAKEFVAGKLGREVTEKEVIEYLAREELEYVPLSKERPLRIYKYGANGSWDAYKTVRRRSEEESVLRSPYIHFYVVVYDNGKVINVDNLFDQSPLPR